MINIKVDEAYAYDYLAILDVKKKKNLNNSAKVFNECFLNIEKQVGDSLHAQIINSKEYENLLNANLQTFEGVEKARYGLISAKELDNYNMQRYICKKELQKKFFNSEVLEQKT